MKKFSMLLVALVLVGTVLFVPVFGAEQENPSVIASGTADEWDHDWTLTEGGVLTVSGGWHISGYGPWCDYMDQVRHLVLGEGIENIGSEAFFGYPELQTVTLPQSLTRIEMGAFADCEALKTVSFPNGLEQVEDMAFARCRSLTAAELPDSVTELGGGVFRGCSSLRSVKLPRGLKAIGSGLFEGCGQLTALTIPRDVTEIGERAFRECDRLQAVTVPCGVTQIGREAFAFCGSFRNITIPESVTAIGDGAFSGCYLLQDITFSGNPPVFGEDVFTWVRATARCARELGWTESTMQNYGGTLFWTDLNHVHQWGDLPIVPPTCTEPGLYRGWGCLTCGWTNREPEVIPPEHSWDAGVYTDPTTTADGFLTYTCLGCGTTRTVIHTGSQLPAIAIVKNPEDQTVVTGSAAQFTATARGDGLRYQWQYQRPNGTKWIHTAMEGAATDTVTVAATAARNGYRYRCRITDKQGNTVYTQPAALGVVFIQKQPAETFATTGTQVQLSVAVNMDTAVSCRWQYTADGVTWVQTDAQTSTLTVEASATQNGCQYRCVITCEEMQLVSRAAVLHVSDPVAWNDHPRSVTCAVGEIATFTVVADNAGTYQWQYYNPVHKVWKNTVAPGNRTDTLQITVKNHNNNYQYRCVITGLDGQEYISDPATLTLG